jgi:hypothetical protein
LIQEVKYGYFVSSAGGWMSALVGRLWTIALSYSSRAM